MSVKHVIVDGSNIATEGRDSPSLAQLDEAVQAFIEEYSPKYVTVVVDATFPNRIDSKERKTYEQAVNANELVTPPAGAIGRGDAFILQIARRANASILSNDSFQEFHGDYPWLFDKGRLIGGKPVPHVGWVFMDRAPVRGPTSRRAVSEARKVAKAADKVAKAAEKAVAVAEAGADGAEAPAPRRRRTRKAVAAAPVEARAAAPDAGEAPAVAETAAEPSPAGDSAGASKGVEPYNEALPFIEFVARHPVGSEVDTVVERFSSHGAYVLVGAARAYVPLRNMAHPAPRSAKEVLRVGEERRFVVVSIDPPRRGIDLAVPGVVDVTVPGPVEGHHEPAATAAGEAPTEPTKPRRARTSGKAAAQDEAAPPAKPSRGRKKAAAPAEQAEVAAPPAKPGRGRKKAAVPAEQAAVAAAPAKPGRGRKKVAAPVEQAEMAASARPARAGKKAAAAGSAEHAHAATAPPRPARETSTAA
ncbi:MAG TPA: S1 RNA-binding domain-containing protein, partial [Acidimicrobiales bacterium]